MKRFERIGWLLCIMALMASALLLHYKVSSLEAFERAQAHFDAVVTARILDTNYVTTAIPQSH